MQTRLLRVRCRRLGHLTDPIKTSKGVRKGCLLASLLFNFYLNNLVYALHDSELHPPKLTNRHISDLLYVYDAVILSRTPIGLKRALRKLAAYCESECLKINYQKTKILAFGKKPKLRSWELQGHKLEQVTNYKYLGMVVQASGTNKLHINSIGSSAGKNANCILKFFRAQGGFFVPAALKLYKARTLAQLLYGSFLGPPSSAFSPLE